MTKVPEKGLPLSQQIIARLQALGANALKSPDGVCCCTLAAMAQTYDLGATLWCSKPGSCVPARTNIRHPAPDDVKPLYRRRS